MVSEYLNKPLRTEEEATEEATRASIKELVADLANDLKELVSEIEAKPATTRNHYDKYMGLISQTSQGKATHARIIAMALIEAGASERGVMDAMQICYPR